MLNGYGLPPLSGGKPKEVVLFLHGVGDSGKGGLLSIGEMWRKDLPDCEFLCPDAPFPFDMAPADFGGRQWFSLKSFTPAHILSGAQNAAPYLNDYIDHVLLSRGLTADKMALVGFSQGTIMALYTAPRRRDPVSALLGYSGMLTGGAALLTEKRSSPPILLVHGTMDEVLPFALMDEAERELKAAGLSVRSIACPLVGHTIDDTGIKEGLAFLKKNFGISSHSPSFGATGAG